MAACTFVLSLEDVLLLGQCEATLLAFLQENRLIRTDMSCRKCKNICAPYLLGQKFFAKCTKSGCKYNVNLSRDSFFEYSRLSYCDILSIIYCFTVDLSIVKTANTLNLSSITCTVERWFNLCYEICIRSLCNGYDNIVIGGLGTTVDIDILKLSKDIWNVQHITEENWFFIGIQRESDNCFFIPVKHRIADTLFTIIKKCVKPGTKIITGCGPTNGPLQYENYHFECIKYSSRNNISQDTDSNTNITNSNWWDTKRNFSSYDGSKQSLEGCLAKYLWMKKNMKKDLFQEFLTNISEQYIFYDGDMNKEILDSNYPRTPFEQIFIKCDSEPPSLSYSDKSEQVSIKHEPEELPLTYSDESEKATSIKSEPEAPQRTNLDASEQISIKYEPEAPPLTCSDESEQISIKHEPEELPLTCSDESEQFSIKRKPESPPLTCSDENEQASIKREPEAPHLTCSDESEQVSIKRERGLTVSQSHFRGSNNNLLTHNIEVKSLTRSYS